MLLLGPCSLLNCASVCRQWRDWARDERNWLRHVRRVSTELMEWQSPYRPGYPLWRSFAQRLLCKEPDLRFWKASLIRLPDRVMGDWDCDIIHLENEKRYDVSLWHIDHINGVVGHIVSVRENDGKRGLDVRSMPDGTICYFNRAVDPKRWRRYHTIVRDTDCGEPRETHRWLSIHK
jgi:hypothetical protein